MAQIPARGDCSRQLTRKQAGDAWEAAARRWLESKGLRFIAANVRERGGEIDLIMRDGKTTVFVEVRYRRSGLYGGAAAIIEFRALLWRRGGQCDPQQATQIITYCPLVARPPEWEF
ncbi:hypothetical protein LTSEGIV_4421 [Salmonella enterica subsp. enterica serovar Give str. S5-487]|nr:hypothetical protein LTSEGIV_4421 [Salmonella enterica subsp. enterica serovar Give str. S5-487]